MQAFWDQGYCATSMTRLVSATKLNPGSIYAAFNSKEGLFLAALDHYGKLSTEKIRRALGESDSPLAGIRDYFKSLAGTASDSEAERSCFLVNTILELARHNKNVQLRVNAHFEAIEACFRTALETAQSTGELPAGKDPAALAAFLMSSIWGVRVLGGTGPAPGRTDAVINQVLKLLD
ncbi:MAG: TetR/AcrR family transcriptional regulator [Gammaproteobacteria bacterium]|nr:TetR/AcrR family transcriptional regulator [Gammaproteobacteria bacterium]